jgi:predicted DsbA family dithiol-disulfide isomerase
MLASLLEAVPGGPDSAKPLGAKPFQGPTEPVALIGDQAVSPAKLEELVGNRLFRFRTEEYNSRRRLLEVHIDEIVLQREANARGITVGELTRLEIDDKVASQTVAPADLSSRVTSTGQAQDVSEVLPGNGNVTMHRARLRERRRQFLRDLYSKHGVRILLEPPRMVINNSGAPSRGPLNAPVTIVEFVDYQCPFCARSVATLKSVGDTYKGKVRLVMRDFPLPGHSEAQRAAEAASCADQQGKFWEMHEQLFAQGPEQLQGIVSQIGLDRSQFTACMESGQAGVKWRRDQEEGIRSGVGGTPTTFVNGRMVSGVVSYEALVDVIEDELLRAAATPLGGEHARGN